MIQITFEKRNLLSVLASVQGICARRSVMDATSNVYVECNNREMTIKSTDLEVAFQATIAIEHVGSHDRGASFAFLLNAKRWYEIVKDFDETIEMRYDGTACFLATGSVKAQLLVRSSNDFPEMPQKIENIVLVSRETLVQSLDWTASIAASSGANQALQSVLFELESGKIMLTATDGHCLAHSIAKTHKSPIENTEKKQWLISKRAAGELKKILEESSSETDVVLGTCASYVVFSGSFFNFFVKISSGKFPEYSEALNRSGYGECICKKDALTKSLRRINAMLAGKFLPACFEISGDVLRININNKETGEIIDTLELQKNNSIEKTKLFIYAPYVLQGISKMDAAEVHMFTGGYKKPIIIHEERNESSLIYLVMPVVQT